MVRMGKERMKPSGKDGSASAVETKMKEKTRSGQTEEEMRKGDA